MGRVELITCLLLAWAIAFVNAYSKLSDGTLQGLLDAGDGFDIDNAQGLLQPILKPRVPGTPGSTEVLQHFVDYFAKELPEWRVELQNSSAKTPMGDNLVPFVNFIATRDPPWGTDGHVSRLALTAHYDSKLSPTGFIGATDSAAPCAMLMHIAKAIDSALNAKWKMEAPLQDDLDDSDDAKGVQIILFDGEEAFKSWTSTDSLYGSRALAEHWEGQMYPAMSTFHTPLHAISLLVLLDLLGSKSPSIPSYFATSHWAYQAMANLESRLRSLKIMRSPEDQTWLFESGKTNFRSGYIGDDHEPFMSRGVQILHLIPSPFPHVWHTMEDDGEHLDMNTVHDWTKIVTAFTAEWVDLELYMKPTTMRVEKSEL